MSAADAARGRALWPPRLARPSILLVGLLILATFVVVAVGAPVIAPYDPIHQDAAVRLTSPSLAHPFGTDNFGRDILSRVIWGARIDLQIAILGVLFPFLIGTVVGTLAGYFGGIVDAVFMRLVDVILAFPFLVLMLAIIAILGPGLGSFYIAMALVGWVSYARLVYMRGAAGASGDNDRDKGFKRALGEYPNVKVVHEVFTNWQQDQGKQQILDFAATGISFDGIWTSGIDNVIVDALLESDSPLVPIVGSDNAGFVGQLNSVEGLKGVAVTNPGSIGGAGVALAVKILGGEKPAEQTVHVKPEAWDNVTDEGRAKLKAAADPALDPEWPVSISIPDWTTYTKEQIIACKGPGE